MKKNKITFLLVICLTAVVLVSCSCNKRYYKTFTEMETALNEVYIKGSEAENVTARKDKLHSLLKVDALNVFDTFVSWYIKAESSVDAEKIANVKTELGTSISELINENLNENEFSNKVSVIVKEKLLKTKELAGAGYSEYGVNNNSELTGTNFIDERIAKFENASLLSYLTKKAYVQINEAVDAEKYDDYQNLLFEDIQEKTRTEISNIDVTISDDELDGKTYDEVLVSRASSIYTIVEQFATNIMKATTQPEPIRFELKSFGDFFNNFFDNFFIYPVGLLLMFFSKIFGGKYILGLLITTIIIRTLGWPIYTRTNDMSLKMKLMEPEQAKIQEKYARRKDEESQRMMQMEMMQLYKKYKVGLGGCLMPFLQFPIFMAVFRAISRLPFTNGFAGSKDWVSQIDSTIFGLDLFADKTGGVAPNQLIGIIVLVILVVGTQVLQQLFANKKQKEQQEKAQADIPAYRRKAVEQTKGGMASQMKIMMWTMTAMMGVFVYTSAAGLGVYWLIGNLYAIAQQFINSKNSEKRMEKLKEKHSR